MINSKLIDPRCYKWCWTATNPHSPPLNPVIHGCGQISIDNSKSRKWTFRARTPPTRDHVSRPLSVRSLYNLLRQLWGSTFILIQQALTVKPMYMTVKLPFIPKKSHQISTCKIGQNLYEMIFKSPYSTLCCRIRQINGNGDFSDNPALEATSPAAATSSCAIFWRAWVTGGWDKFFEVTWPAKDGNLTKQAAISPTKMGI